MSLSEFEDVSQTGAPKQHTEILKQYSDGWAMHRLLSQDSIDTELNVAPCLDDEMGPVYGLFQSGKGTFLSLRDSENKSHMVIQIRSDTGHVVVADERKRNALPKGTLVPYLREFFLENDYKLGKDWHYIGLVQIGDELVDIHDLPDPIYIGPTGDTGRGRNHTYGLNLTHYPNARLPQMGFIDGHLHICGNAFDQDLSLRELLDEVLEQTEYLEITGSIKLCWRDERGLLHNENGPAQVIINDDDIIVWYKQNDKFHRNPDMGPALYKIDRETGKLKSHGFYTEGCEIYPETMNLTF